MPIPDHIVNARGLEFYTDEDQYITFEVNEDDKEIVLEIEVNQCYYKDRDNYTAARDATIFFTKEQAIDFLVTLQAWMEQL